MGRNELISPYRHINLWLIAAVSLAGYFLLSRWFPLAPLFNRAPVADIRTFTPTLLSGLGYGAWLIAAFGLLALAYRSVQRRVRPPSLLFILIAATLFGLPLLRTFPVNATDLYRYVIRGRVSSAYSENPFTVPPRAIPDDPFLPLAGEWAGETSPYGPIWELTAAAVTKISRLDLYLGLTLFKILGLATHLVLAALIWQHQTEGAPARRAANTLLWAWNPALLLMFVVDAHNDGFMMIWLMLGFYLIRRGRPTAGFVLMLIAPLTKPIGVLPLPFFFLHIWRGLASWRARARFFLMITVVGLLAMTLAFLPFGSPLDLGQRLIREASSGGGFSIGALILLIARSQGSDLPLATVGQVAIVLFALVIAWLLWRTWRGRDPVRAAAEVFVAYLWQALNFRIWYTVWPIPWLLVDNSETESAAYRRRVGVWMLLTSQLSVLIYGHLRVFVFNRNHLPAHLLGVPFTFALPFILAFWREGREREAEAP